MISVRFSSSTLENNCQPVNMARPKANSVAAIIARPEMREVSLWSLLLLNVGLITESGGVGVRTPYHWVTIKLKLAVAAMLTSN